MRRSRSASTGPASPVIALEPPDGGTPTASAQRGRARKGELDATTSQALAACRLRRRTDAAADLIAHATAARSGIRTRRSHDPDAPLAVSSAREDEFLAPRRRPPRHRRHLVVVDDPARPPPSAADAGAARGDAHSSITSSSPASRTRTRVELAELLLGDDAVAPAAASSTPTTAAPRSRSR